MVRNSENEIKESGTISNNAVKNELIGSKIRESNKEKEKDKENKKHKQTRN